MVAQTTRLKQAASDLPVSSTSSARHNSSSTILALPQEITSEVFILAMPIDFAFRTDYNNLVTATRFKPLPFQYVCRFWRNITIHTPQLWSRYDFGHSTNIWNKTSVAGASFFCPSTSGVFPTLGRHIEIVAKIRIIFVSTYLPSLNH
jgi:hypothetical protein